MKEIDMSSLECILRRLAATNAVASGRLAPSAVGEKIVGRYSTMLLT